MHIVLWVLIAGIVLFFLITYVCFLLTFYSPKRKPPAQDEFPLPPDKVYEPHREQMTAWMKQIRSTPCEEVSVQSFDGLTLRGKYYECTPGAPIELMFHGYRGTCERDLSGGIERCFALGRNVLTADLRAHGNSDGHIISFGINESRDCLTWIDFMIERFGADVKIVLCGVSMGAATVLITAGKDLPKNVVGILADCGYSDAKGIIRKIIRQLHLPVKLLYPFVKWGAKIYGGFDVEEASPVAAMKKCSVPIFFVHGEADDFVPCDMSRINYEACVAPKKLLTVPDAGHGLCYVIDPDSYLKQLGDFSTEHDWYI